MISVIIPTHKRADLLFYELERIYQQENVDIEVVVINDIEEKDETDLITELFPKVVYIKSSKIQGPSEKHKMGFSITSGEYVYMPDDDDYLIDNHFFEKAVSILEEDSNLSFVSGNVNIRNENDNHEIIEIKKRPLNVSGRVKGLVYLQEFQHKYQKPASTVSTIFRRKCLDSNMIEMSDSSIYIDALLHGDAFILDEIVAEYRVQHKKGNSLTTSASLQFIENVLKQKESFYYQVKTRIPRPKDFWSFHFIKTYELLAQKKNCESEKQQLLRWGFRHTHGSLRMIYFLFHQTIRVLLSNAKYKE